MRASASISTPFIVSSHLLHHFSLRFFVNSHGPTILRALLDSLVAFFSYLLDHVKFLLSVEKAGLFTTLFARSDSGVLLHHRLKHIFLSLYSGKEARECRVSKVCGAHYVASIGFSIAQAFNWALICVVLGFRDKISLRHLMGDRFIKLAFGLQDWVSRTYSCNRLL